MVYETQFWLEVVCQSVAEYITKYILSFIIYIAIIVTGMHA